MNPYLRARDRQRHHASFKASVSEMQGKKTWTVCADWNIKSIALSVKTACMLLFVCDGLSCLALHGAAVMLWRPLFHCRCQRYVRSGSVADWQTVPLQPAQPTSLSATLAVTKSIMFSLLCHVWHHGAFPSIFFSFSWAEWCLQSGQHAKQREKVYLFENLEQTQMHSGCKGVVVLSGRWGESQ